MLNTNLPMTVTLDSDMITKETFVSTSTPSSLPCKGLFCKWYPYVPQLQTFQHKYTTKKTANSNWKLNTFLELIKLPLWIFPFNLWTSTGASSVCARGLKFGNRLNLGMGNSNLISTKFLDELQFLLESKAPRHQHLIIYSQNILLMLESWLSQPWSIPMWCIDF